MNTGIAVLYDNGGRNKLEISQLHNILSPNGDILFMQLRVTGKSWGFNYSKNDSELVDNYEFLLMRFGFFYKDILRIREQFSIFSSDFQGSVIRIQNAESGSEYIVLRIEDSPHFAKSIGKKAFSISYTYGEIRSFHESFMIDVTCADSFCSEIDSIIKSNY